MTEQSPGDRKRSRSPGYPAFALPQAIEKAKQLYKHDKRNPVPVPVAGEHWGYSPTSSAVLLSIATLKKFGLLEEVEGAGARMVKLTPLALHIILSSEDSEEWRTAVAEAALAPAIHAELWDLYGEELPSDMNLKRSLILQRGFADAAANDLIREYKATMSFASLKSPPKMDPTTTRIPTEEPVQTTLSQPAPPPATAAPAPAEKALKMRRMTFPLADSDDAELILPPQLSEQDYDMLKAMIDSFFTVSKRGLIRRDANQQEGSTDGGE